MKRKFFNWRRAGVGWILCLCLACFTLWNCAGPVTGAVEELEVASRSFIDEIEIEIDGDLPPGMGAAFQALGMCEEGRRLLAEVAGLNIPLKFSVFLTNEGEPVREVAMGYGGSGYIYYTPAALRVKYLDDLLFHELFHMLQFGYFFVVYSIHAEMEAYLSQYLYTRVKVGSVRGQMVDPTFDGYIQELGQYFNADGDLEFKTDADREEFDRIYNRAVGYLMVVPAYGGYDWQGTRNFATLEKIFGNE